MSWLGYLFILVGAVFAVLAGWHAMDRRADQKAWNQLIETAMREHRFYDPAMVATLPEPARRYFAYTIQPGTPLHTVVEVDMSGKIGLGSKDAPNYKPMQAVQILAPPHGLVWKLDAGMISGSDGATPDGSWTRFWLFGLIPVVRASGKDHQRSALGRVVAEAAFWAPASLLPSGSVRWQAIDQNAARAIVLNAEFEQAVDILVDEAGAPTRVVIQRWSNANPDKRFREQPFGGELSQFENFSGYRLPTRVEGGNHIGTAEYFPFFKADVNAIRFPANHWS
ncbi:MAG: DUF6544 family protein [Pseudomonadota bacterium]